VQKPHYLPLKPDYLLRNRNHRVQTTLRATGWLDRHYEDRGCELEVEEHGPALASH
jgi:hypothetical protein